MHINSVALYKSQKFEGNRTITTTDVMVTVPSENRSEDYDFDFFDLSLADLIRLHNVVSNLIKIEENEGR